MDAVFKATLGAAGRKSRTLGEAAKNSPLGLFWVPALLETFILWV
jgi:hypothetical protein